jgi:hypothetical protein
MQEQVKQVGGVDKVEELMDEVEDAQTDAREIQEAIGRQLEVPGVGDGRAVEMPSAQKRGGKAGFLEQLRKRIMGVARPMMRLRQVIPLKMGACWSVAPNKAAIVDEELVMIARNPAKEAMAKLNERIENIGKKEDNLQRKIDLELAHVAVNARRPHRLILQPLGILPQEGDLSRQGMLGRVEDELVELGEIGINVVPSLAVARKIDAVPIVDGAVADRPGHGIIKGLLRGGVGFGGTRGQKTDPGLGGRKRIGRRKYGRAVGRGRVGVTRHRPIRRLARAADLEN